MGEVLVLVDGFGGSISGGGSEVGIGAGGLGAGRDGTIRRSTGVLLTIAGRLGEPVAVVCGGRGQLGESAVRVLGRYGAVGVLCAGPESAIPAMREDPQKPGIGVSATSVVAALAELVERRRPAAVLIAAGYAGQEIAGRLAVRLDSGVITDAVDVLSGPEGPVAVQSCLAHSYLVESRVRRGVPVITVRSDAAVPVPVPVGDAMAPWVETVSVPGDAGERVPRVLGVVRPPLDHSPPLATADVVVAGGRGVGSAESFGMLAEIAAALGGAVGGTHTATELGWCSRDRRIGLTGQTVHPRLYLASGISGSVRHRAGMQGAKTVVAIGDDPAAPIFQMADLGVVGDLREVLPALLEEITRRIAGRSPGSLSEPDLIET